jgi:hypothetical protein
MLIGPQPSSRFKKNPATLRVLKRDWPRAPRCRIGQLARGFGYRNPRKVTSNKDRRADQRSPENGSDKMSATEVGGRTDIRILGGRFSVLSTEPSSSLPAIGSW